MTKKRGILLSTVLILFVSVGTGAFILLRSQPIVPKRIQKQVNFPIFYPELSDAKIDQNTFKYDAANQSVSFIVNFKGKKITFAEQSAPERFADDPSFYSKFVEKLNNYLTFDSVNGRVDITLPSKVASQTGVMSAKGTLLFAKSNSNLESDNWKQLFNSLIFTRPI